MREIQWIFKNGHHQAAFEAAIEEVNRKDYGLLSALYLLTADVRLRSVVKRRSPDGHFLFEPFRIPSCAENSYTLY